MRESLQRRFGKRLRELRASAGLTQEQLAEASGMSTQNLARVEAGLRFVTAESLGALADGLGVAVSALFEFGGERQASAARRRLESIASAGYSERKLRLVADVANRILRDR